LLASLITSGCASMLPGPPQPAVKLTITNATTFYSVQGTTTSKIFEEIKARGLLEQDGEHAMGLAAAQSEIVWRARETGTVCTPESVTITLDLVVTLPMHERPDDLSNDLRERWEHFAAAVAAHEQRHVEIFVSGANTLKARIQEILKKWASCKDLEATLQSVWNTGQAETKAAQADFDATDRARVNKDRNPLQAEIDTREARLTGLTAEVQQLDGVLEDLSRRAGAVQENIAAVNAEIEKANGSCSRATERILPLCLQHNELVVSHNALAAEHSSVLAHRNRIADEHNVLVKNINGLIEALNWVH